MKNMDLSHILAEDIVTFRCGGSATVQKVTEGSDENFPIKIQIRGYHCLGSGGWSYDATGSQGESTGEHGKAPFDILRVDREAAVAITFCLNPKPNKVT